MAFHAVTTTIETIITRTGWTAEQITDELGLYDLRQEGGRWVVNGKSDVLKVERFLEPAGKFITLDDGTWGIEGRNLAEYEYVEAVRADGQVRRVLVREIILDAGGTQVARI